MSELEPSYLNPAGIDWQQVRHATFEVQQSIRYEYPGPIEDVRQTLMLAPPREHGSQRLLDHHLTVFPHAPATAEEDRFGNRVCRIELPRVEDRLQFDVTFTVDRWAGEGPALRPGEAAVYLLTGALTQPSPLLTAFAGAIGRGSDGPAALAERIMHRVAERVQYTKGVTGVRTTAHEALEMGQGVCQDYAHIMLATCRLLGLPARYVSGHLLGEGAMHAWVQVLLPVVGHHNAELAWHAFDPTHDRRAGLPYITIAVGRDYADVSPTRGAFRAPYSGRLADGSKIARVLAVA